MNTIISVLVWIHNLISEEEDKLRKMDGSWVLPEHLDEYGVPEDDEHEDTEP